mmetsp:Transcript_14794/g.30457  ORF Transcript_14794/g.30457 Transcript_14794/m.30457 type:complete len:331 (-) Transcript_14794:122-1114(-)
MMQQSVFLSTGDPLVDTTIKIQAVPVPELRGKEVLVTTRALSINPVDYKVLKGSFPNKAKPEEKGWGSDMAGVIAAVGEDVKSFKVGDEVYSDAILHSPFATSVRIPSHKVGIKPSNMTFQEAATVPLAGQTALQALRDHGKMKTGMKVCVFGGSGGVGTFALQIAKALGASYIATTSTNKELCESLGADEVVNYREANVGEVLKGGDFDIVFDTVGGKAHWDAGRKIIKKGGRFVTIIGDGGSMAKTMTRAVWRMFKSNFGGTSYSIFLTKNGSGDLEVLREMVEGGKIKAVVDGEAYKFEDDGIRSMLEKLMTGRTKGKLVMEVAANN